MYDRSHAETNCSNGLESGIDIGGLATGIEKNGGNWPIIGGMASICLVLIGGVLKLAFLAEDVAVAVVVYILHFDDSSGP